jgi:hypothetical protein
MALRRDVEKQQRHIWEKCRVGFLADARPPQSRVLGDAVRRLLNNSSQTRSYYGMIAPFQREEPVDDEAICAD